MRTNKRVTAVIIQDCKLLLIHRFKDGSEYWTIPGGGVEEGEDLETALKREVREETGLELIAYRHLFDQFGDHGQTCHFFLCELEPGEPKLGGPELEEQSPTNQYILEWVDAGHVANLNVYPKSDTLLDVLANN